jgi:hypothetical protein
MYKKLMIITVIALVTGLMFAPVIAKGPTGPAGKSNVGHLYLLEKDPITWEIIEDGAWGKMKYNLAGPNFYFVLNCHNLETGLEYTLIYYPDKDGNPWPRTDIICLGSGIANEYGDVHIKESVNTGDLPNTEVDINPGAKIWLVLSSDVDCEGQVMDGWQPTRYLFEYDLITFDDTDELPPEIPPEIPY